MVIMDESEVMGNKKILQKFKNLRSFRLLS
jgi:hypothetical protein